MTDRPVPYTRTAQVRLDANGDGRVQLAPAGVDWVISSRSVTITNAAGLNVTFSEYLDDVSESTFLQGTYDGAKNTSDSPQLLTPGQVIYGVWTGGPPGELATFRAAGVAWPAGQGAEHL